MQMEIDQRKQYLIVHSDQSSQWAFELVDFFKHDWKIQA